MLKINTKVLGMVSTNVYTVYNEETKEAVIIDPAAKAEDIIAFIEEKDLQPKAIFLTHGHFDHIMAADELRKKYDIKIYAGKEEEDFLKKEDRNGSRSLMGRAFTLEADAFFSDKEEVNILGHTWVVITTPGHTPGSVCYYIPDEKLVFTGDTLFFHDYGRCDLYGGDERKIYDSLVNKLFILPEDTTFYPGHDMYGKIGDEKSHNPINRYRIN